MASGDFLCIPNRSLVFVFMAVIFKIYPCSILIIQKFSPLSTPRVLFAVSRKFSLFATQVTLRLRNYILEISFAYKNKKEDTTFHIVSSVLLPERLASNHTHKFTGQYSRLCASATAGFSLAALDTPLLANSYHLLYIPWELSCQYHIEPHS